MIIIIDTREQKPLSFTGHKTTRRKLDEGDYATENSEKYIVIERKSVPDYYGSITNDHARFKKEILRSRDKGKRFFIYLEGRIEDVLRYTQLRHYNPRTVSKIIQTMRERYTIEIIESETREEMSEKIIKKLEEYEGENNG